MVPICPLQQIFKIAKKVEEEAIKILKEKGINCISLPSLPLGVCKYLDDFPGTISISWKVLYKLIVNEIESLAKYGFKYFMICNFHMDLEHIKAIYKAIKKLRKKVMICEPLSAYYFKGELFERTEEEIHADVKETSLALYLFPKLVKNHKIEPFKVKFGLLNSFKKFKDMGAKEAYIGDPSKASKDYGEKLFKKLVEKVVESAYLLKEGKCIDLPKKIKIALKIS